MQRRARIEIEDRFMLGRKSNVLARMRRSAPTCSIARLAFAWFLAPSATTFARR